MEPHPERSERLVSDPRQSPGIFHLQSSLEQRDRGYDGAPAHHPGRLVPGDSLHLSALRRPAPRRYAVRRTGHSLAAIDCSRPVGRDAAHGEYPLLPGPGPDVPWLAAVGFGAQPGAKAKGPAVLVRLRRFSRGPGRAPAFHLDLQPGGGQQQFPQNPFQLGQQQFLRPAGRLPLVLYQKHRPALYPDIAFPAGKESEAPLHRRRGLRDLSDRGVHSVPAQRIRQQQAVLYLVHALRGDRRRLRL